MGWGCRWRGFLVCGKGMGGSSAVGVKCAHGEAVQDVKYGVHLSKKQ